MLCRNELHVINGPADLTRDGECLGCSHNRQQRYRDARRAAAALMADLTARAKTLQRI